MATDFYMGLYDIIRLNSIELLFVLTFLESANKNLRSGEQPTIDVIRFYLSFSLVDRFFVFSYAPLNKPIVSFLIDKSFSQRSIFFVTMQKTRDFHLWQFYLVASMSVMELKKEWGQISTTDSVDSNFSVGVKCSMKSKFLCFHKKSTNGRMMRNLL
jgi:hypothetical protein